MKTLEDGSTSAKITGKENIKKLSELANLPSGTGEQKKEAFKKLSENFNSFWKPINEYIVQEIKREHKEIMLQRNPPVQVGDRDPHHYADNLAKVQQKLDDLLNHLKNVPDDRKYLYDNKFTSLLTTLSSSLHLLTPSHFANPRHPELLDAVRAGLEGFVEQMERVYVNGYDGHEESINIDKLVIDGSNNDKKLTDDGRNLSKVFLTIMNTIYDDLHKLHFECEHYWKDNKLCETQKEKDNPLGLYLKRCGYTVAKKETSKDGESQCKTGVTGGVIFSKLVATTASTSGTYKLIDITESIATHLNNYNDVCHLSTLTSKRHPCSVYEMLCWLTGLPHNPAYLSLRADALPSLMQSDKPTTDKDDDIDIDFYDHTSLYIDTYPKRTTYSDIDTLIEYLCSRSYDVITCIAGTGDAETVYGSDFCNNAIRLHYPQNGSDCLDMLLDILRRLFLPLKFLQRQCGVSVLYNGWRQCYYGRDVSTANWPCKEHSRSEPKCESNCQAKCEPNCQAKSPLMSYLNDCLPGHLPHQLTKIGCKVECSTCSASKPGMPCLTPLGFKGFSGSKRAGTDICDVLDKWFNIHHFKDIFCLNTKTPSSLPEHFGFALSLAKNLNDSYTTQSNSMETVNDKFKGAMKSVSMKLYSDPSKLTQAVTNAYGATSIRHSDCSQHLMNLTRDGICADAGVYCAPFLYSLCSDYCTYRRRKHAGTYLSWAVYLPWNLWNYLRSLYDEFCDIVCKNWGCRSCLNSDTCKPGEHGILDKSCKCSTVVDCGGVSPTLYKYGFVFGNAGNLKVHKNTCFQLRTQLMNVLKSSYFTDLFNECDEFIFTIRAPFFWTTVALWLLSLLYLIHIMVIRLDLLHIKSHLHSPSSHRIAAQSLLAAARVNKLNRVFYLQP
ncbi:hypothetical protein, conserved [Babesia bigemina]|uniref:C3H1-type domain-containing protein n=1 Tax=Babesia bigemina TaxID=5866 RepID=A0A061BTV9_BABBI|nr:hypothetical protein, conserved [Babesia bigemina]CDR71909.1 hypothetical protein, conserved [Babesia bigemina]|eukprot:XP_012770851.1 hypothetical protein, conserved [Babesia bigemina]